MVRTFVELAATRNVQATARRLVYSESTVLHHVRELEKCWRITLFAPGVRALTLTSQGRAALEMATQLVRLVEALEALGQGPVAPTRSGARRAAVPPRDPVGARHTGTAHQTVATGPLLQHPDFSR